MSLRTFTAIQPICDAKDCKFTMNGDYEQWYEEDDVQRAAEDWTDGDNYVSEDRAVWLCERHKPSSADEDEDELLAVYPDMGKRIEATS